MINQGKIIVERDGDDYLIMFPDGGVEAAVTRRQVEARAKKWFADNLGELAVGIGAIEWRGEASQ